MQFVSGLMKVAAKKQIAASKASVGSGEITSGDDISWTLVGSGKEKLVDELRSLYWQGVRRDLETILWTVKNWTHPSLAGVQVEDETDFFVHGFDTFVDQVSQESRAFANRYGEFSYAVSSRA